MRLGKIIEVRFGDAKNKDQHSICIAFLMLKVKLRKDTAKPKSHYIAKPCSDVETCMEGIKGMAGYEEEGFSSRHSL